MKCREWRFQKETLFFLEFFSTVMQQRDTNIKATSFNI